MSDEAVVYLVGHEPTKTVSPLEARAGIESGKGFYDYHKIGVSKDAKLRVQNMNSSTPHNLDLLNTINTSSASELENALHTRYQEYRHSGEWFRLPINAINSLKAFDELEPEEVTNKQTTSIGPDQSSLYVQVENQRGDST